MTQTTSEIYIVQKGDTLTKVAKVTGVSQARLVKLNDLKNPNRLQIGQPLYLSERVAFSVKALFLDSLRCPIENLSYQLVTDGKVHRGKTGKDGLSVEKISANAKSPVEILIKDAVGNWQKVGATVSGYGEKLITLISPYVMFKDKLEPHPPTAPTTPTPPAKPPATQPSKPTVPSKPQGSPTPNNPDVKKKKKKGKGGESVIEIGVDLPEALLQNMLAYEDKPITEADWKDVADSLRCEVNVLKAIAKVESGGRSAFWVINDTATHKVHAPKIMFERHYFHRLTCANGPSVKNRSGRYLHGKGVAGCTSPYDTYPDICWPVGYRSRSKLNQADAKMHDNRVDRGDIRDNSQDYLRLINAYRLNNEAALKSASWGKFQVMGANYSACGEGTVWSFVAKMCRNEVGQIELLAGFIKANTALWNAVKEKNWHLIAYNYNGPNYRNDTAYDVKMREAYEYYRNNTV